MADLGWLDVSTIDFNALLLLEPLHIEYLAKDQPSAAMGTALLAYPAVRWYLIQLHPPIETFIANCLRLAKSNPSANELRQAELTVLNAMQDWLVYLLAPKKYDQLDFLGWDNDSLLSMADYNNKVVLDIGSGTGRLAFTVAPYARVVYAIEPVANLRRFIWDKRGQLGVNNVYPIDGTLTQIPFTDNFADILMAGHVFGDDFEAEYQEMMRVVREGGLILLHPGTNASSENKAHQFLMTHGFSFAIFEEPGDGLKRKYWKLVHKQLSEKENSDD